jgi:hypothetical protein
MHASFGELFFPELFTYPEHPEHPEQISIYAGFSERPTRSI